MVEVITHSRPFAERRTMSGCWSQLLHPGARLFGRVAMLPALGVVHCGSPMQAGPHTFCCSERNQPSVKKASDFLWPPVTFVISSELLEDHRTMAFQQIHWFPVQVSTI